MNKANLKEGVVRSLLKPINTSAVIILGVYTVVWGFWVGNPFWELFGHAALYQYMAVVPELGWGLVAAAMGIVTIYGVLRPSYRNLVRGALSLFFQWLVVAIFYFAGDWQNTGGITASTFCIYAAFVWLNLRVNKHRFNWSEKQANAALRHNNENEY